MPVPLQTLLLAVAVSGSPSLASAAETPVAPSSAACTETAPAYDMREVQCRVAKASATRRFRFKANFSGGHDDTSARLEAFVDDAPLVCDEGSKTKLFAEDGAVSLWCTVSVADRAPSDHVFKAVVRWSHAEYVGFEWAAL